MMEDTAAGGGTTINFPGPPAFEQRATIPGREVTTEEPKVEYGALSAEQKANLDQSDQLATQQADTVERQRKQQEAADKIQAEHDWHAVQVNNLLAEEKERRDQALTQDITVWKDRLEHSYNAAKTQPSPSLFADAKTGELAKRAIGLALASAGDVLSAGFAARYGTPRMNAAGEIVEADLQRQREKIAKQKDDVLMARTGMKDAEDARRLALSEIDAKGAGFMARLEAMTKARMSSLKASDQGTIAAQNTLADIQQKKLEYQQRSLAALTEKHTGATTRTEVKGPTVENTVRDTSGTAAKPANDVVMGDPLNPQEAGKPIGEVSSGRGGAQAFATNDVGITTAIDKLKALHEDIQKNGTRPALWNIKQREALAANATLAVQAVSTAGTNLEAMAEEKKSIGTNVGPVGRTLVGDNPRAIEEKIHELENRRTRMRGQALLPVTPAGAARVAQPSPPGASAPTPIVPASAASPASGVPPVPPSPTAAPSPRAQYLDLLQRNPGLRRTTKGKQAMRVYNITEADLGR